MKPARANLRLYAWRKEFDKFLPEDYDLISFEVSIKVRNRIFIEGLQKIMDKLEGRVDAAR